MTTAPRKGITLTRIIETTMWDLRSYHAACDCGWTSKGYERETAAVRAAKAHAAKHGITR